MEQPVHRLHRLLHLKKTDLEMVEIQLPDRAPVVGRTLKDVLLPEGSLIILLVDTEGTPRLPRPESVLRPGDEVIAIIRGNTEDALRKVLTGEEQPV